MNAKQQTGYAIISKYHSFLHFKTVQEADKAKLIANNGEQAIMFPCCLYLPPKPTRKIRSRIQWLTK